MDTERYNLLYERILDGENWDCSTLDELLALAEDRGREKAMAVVQSTVKVHCLTRKPGDQTYFFTKDEKHCCCIDYRSEWDFGNGSPSGARLYDIEIHTNNAFTHQYVPEIQLSEVPECIIELLSYLK